MMNEEEKKEFIKQLKKEEIIDKYGNVGVTNFIKKHGFAKYDSFDREFSQKDIYETFTIDELFDVARWINEDIRLDLNRERVYIDDVELLLNILQIIVIKKQQNE